MGRYAKRRLVRSRRRPPDTSVLALITNDGVCRASLGRCVDAGIKRSIPPVLLSIGAPCRLRLSAHVPGSTEAERMDNAVRRMFSVSKEDVLKAERDLKQAH